MAEHRNSLVHGELHPDDGEGGSTERVDEIHELSDGISLEDPRERPDKQTHDDCRRGN
jgi:hypothetical protein